jgi:phosphatidylglycerol:prolipoprotein diacylglycerol transferase
VNEGRIAGDAPFTLPVHPVQLYEAAFNAVVFLVILVAYRRHKREGTVTALYLTTYPVGRFLLEFLRGDEPVRPLGLTGAQYISVALFGVGLALWAWSRREAREVPSH